MTPEEHSRHMWVFTILRRDANEKLKRTSASTDHFRTLIDLINAIDWAMTQLETTAVTSKVVTEGT